MNIVLANKFFSILSNDVFHQSCCINYARHCVRCTAKFFNSRISSINLSMFHSLILSFECSVSISSTVRMPSVVLLLLLVLVQSYQTHAFQLGLIGNVSLSGSQGFRINQTSCSQCACLLAANDTWVAFNCHLSDGTCEVFRAYNTTIVYTIQTNLNSNFYFQQLPPVTLGATENADAGRSTHSTTLIEVRARSNSLCLENKLD